MRELPLAWATGLMVLEYGGSTVEDRGDHLIVRTPRNPTFHWGNCLLVTDAGLVEDAKRWIREFEIEFPSATWTAIGLPRLPTDEGAWTELGLELGLDDVLVAQTSPRRTPLPSGYSVRRIAGDDWEQVVGLALAENERSGQSEAPSYERFERARRQSDRELSAQDLAGFFGAFAGDALAASLGIVRCGTTARYQNVMTDAAHRRRGLASHLLGVAAGWAGARGCDRWVIVTESTNPAGRVYRSVGFEEDLPTAQAYRRRRP